MNDSNTVKTSLSQELLRRRYLWKDANGRIIETPDQMYRRVATAIAQAEKNYGASEEKINAIAEIFRQLMATGKFLPNSPTLMNAGRENGMLSACFVLPVPDDIVGIFDAVKATALIQKAAGGTGFAFDRLRPTGDIVRSSGGVTSGPISFMQVFAETTNAIQQGAHRRGANMGMMSIEHPDILKFITAKSESGRFENFNFSVKISDTFMKNLSERPDLLHVVENPRTREQFLLPKSLERRTYTLRNLVDLENASGECYTHRDVWNLIVESSHATGEPGIAFIDRMNRDNPTPHIGMIEATNPCGEQPLLPYEACNLGSINLSQFVLPDGSDLAWENLAETIDLAVRFLDDVIDVNFYPIPEVEKVSLGNRKIGLGVMGFADTLIILDIPYNSNHAVEFASRISGFMQTQAQAASRKLAETRGCFPNWSESIWDTRYRQPMRNATSTTIAPTGSISLIAGCSSGIEPIFSLVSRRIALNNEEFIEFHPLVEQVGIADKWLTDSVRQALMVGIPVKDISGIPKALKEILVTAHQVEPEWQVKIAAAIQEHTDNGVSKTVNLPPEATVADVHKIFCLAYERGCKGITVYRDGSRSQQTLSSVMGSSAKMTSIVPRPRPKTTVGKTRKFRMGCGTLFVTVNQDGQGLAEIFANLGKAGGCPAQSEATCRVVSAALRSGVDPKALIEQLKGIRCLSAIGARNNGKGVDVLSCPDAIARALESALGTPCLPETETSMPTCEHCGYSLRKEGGCLVCDRCGESKCG